MASATFLCYSTIIDSETYEQNLLEGKLISAVTSKHVINFIEQNQDADEFIIRINTNGGSVQEGFLIHDLLVNSGKKITTIGEGKVFSIGTVIFLAGTRRIMLPNSDGLIHLPMAGIEDSLNTDDLKEIHDLMMLENDKIAQFYNDKIGIDKNKVMELMKAETLLSANDMVMLGFATEIQEPLKAVAYFNFNNKKKMNDVKTLGEKIDGFISKFDSIINKFSRLKVDNKEFTAANGDVFQVQREEGEIQVGDTASPDGEFVLENGDKVVIAGGVITEIVKSEPAPDEVEALKAKIKELEEKNASLTTSKSALTEDLKAFNESKNELNALVTDLKSYKSQVVIEGRTPIIKTKETKSNAFDMEAYKRVKELTNKQ